VRVSRSVKYADAHEKRNKSQKGCESQMTGGMMKGIGMTEWTTGYKGLDNKSYSRKSDILYHAVYYPILSYIFNCFVQPKLTVFGLRLASIRYKIIKAPRYHPIAGTVLRLMSAHNNI
jgi:hypothetical protein